jgi:hypothetical protein
MPKCPPCLPAISVESLNPALSSTQCVQCVEAGASEEKASAAAIAVSTYQLDRGRLATKDDIAALKEGIAVVRTEIERMGRVVIM